jgi:hypothetical protein
MEPEFHNIPIREEILLVFQLSVEDPRAAVARTVEGVKDVANNLTVANYGAYPYYLMM